MTGLTSRAEVRNAELKLNKALGIDSDTVSLPALAKASLSKFDLSAIFLCSSDGLVLTKASTDPKMTVLTDALSAVAPQLNKRARKTAQQAKLPSCDMVTFFMGSHAVTFSGTDAVFVVCVHNAEYPSAKHLKGCRKLVEDLVWYCSYRAVL